MTAVAAPLGLPVAAAAGAAATALALAHVARHRRRRARFELGQRGDRVCVMVARWEMRRTGWTRAGVAHHAWVDGEDAVAFGEAGAKAPSLAEQREEEAEDAERRLTTRKLVRKLARDPG